MKMRERSWNRTRFINTLIMYNIVASSRLVFPHANALNSVTSKALLAGGLGSRCLLEEGSELVVPLIVKRRQDPG